jgi:hypothetical protein
MTFILALGNSEQVIQISDRRLISNGRLYDDESNKAGILICSNARMAFGFTGLAQFGRFLTRDWLLDALFKCGAPNFSIGKILEDLKVEANKTFSENVALCAAAKKDKRLSIMFSGFIYFDDPPRQGFAILTNYQNFETYQDDIEAWDEFAVTVWHERRPADNVPTLLQRVGNWHSMTQNDMNELRKLLKDKKPSSAIIGKATELIREIADRPAAQGYIGKQLSSVCIPSNLNENIESSYHSAINKHEIHCVDRIILLPEGQDVFKDVKFGKVDTKTPPIVVPKVGRNRPCPCGSGKKYKYCHGR